MNEKAIREAFEEQARTLKPAATTRQLTEQKIEAFAMYHLEKIITKIDAAVDLGRYQASYEFSSNHNGDITSLLKRNMEEAGYTVRNQNNAHSHYMTWTILWLSSSTESTTPTTST